MLVNCSGAFNVRAGRLLVSLNATSSGEGEGIADDEHDGDKDDKDESDQADQSDTKPGEQAPKARIAKLILVSASCVYCLQTQKG